MHAGTPKNKKQNSAPYISYYISYYKLSKFNSAELNQNLTG